jgi:hypothetical protein
MWTTSHSYLISCNVQCKIYVADIHKCKPYALLFLHRCCRWTESADCQRIASNSACIVCMHRRPKFNHRNVIFKRYMDATTTRVYRAYALHVRFITTSRCAVGNCDLQHGVCEISLLTLFHLHKPASQYSFIHAAANIWVWFALAHTAAYQLIFTLFAMHHRLLS